MHIVIFDVDGTLLDTNYLMYASIELTVKELTGYTKSIGPELEEISHTTSMTEFCAVKHLIDLLLPTDLAMQYYHKIETHSAFIFSQLINRNYRIKPLPGAVEFMKGLCGRDDVIVGIATGAFAFSTQIKLEKFDLPQNTIMATCSDAITKTEILAIALEKAKLKAQGIFESMTYVGDGLWDMHSAQELGMDFIGITQSAKQRLNFLQRGVNTVVQAYTYNDTASIYSHLALDSNSGKLSSAKGALNLDNKIPNLSIEVRSTNPNKLAQARLKSFIEGSHNLGFVFFGDLARTPGEEDLQGMAGRLRERLLNISGNGTVGKNDQTEMADNRYLLRSNGSDQMINPSANLAGLCIDFRSGRFVISTLGSVGIFCISDNKVTILQKAIHQNDPGGFEGSLNSNNSLVFLSGISMDGLLTYDLDHEWLTLKTNLQKLPVENIRVKADTIFAFAKKMWNKRSASHDEAIALVNWGEGGAG